IQLQSVDADALSVRVQPDLLPVQLLPGQQLGPIGGSGPQVQRAHGAAGQGQLLPLVVQLELPLAAERTALDPTVEKGFQQRVEPLQGQLFQDAVKFQQRAIGLQAAGQLQGGIVIDATVQQQGCGLFGGGPVQVGQGQLGRHGQRYCQLGGPPVQQTLAEPQSAHVDLPGGVRCLVLGLVEIQSEQG